MPARIIPVLDVLGGHAVHAVAGDRAHYRPVRSRVHPLPDPLGLALAYRERLGFGEVYLADLDAIAGRPPALGLVRALSVAGMRVWVDAGLRDGSAVAGLLDAGAARLVAGLESIAGPTALAGVLRAAGAGSVALSLDLRDGRPVVAEGAGWSGPEADSIADEAVALGCRCLLVLDLARVGTGRGTGSIALLGRLRDRHPGVELVAGGGVSGPGDVAELAALGVSAVLVGSALHDGRLP
jgi:phosphoribosylformimino-5-aminoimidazole carboxamide ribotide isomerase